MTPEQLEHAKETFRVKRFDELSTEDRALANWMLILIDFWFGRARHLSLIDRVRVWGAGVMLRLSGRKR